MEDTNARSSGTGGGPSPEPATGPVSGTPSTSRPLLPRVRRDSVIAFVNETLDAVELLADKLADAVGVRRLGGVSGPPAASPPQPPSSPGAPPPPPAPGAAPPPPPPPAA